MEMGGSVCEETNRFVGLLLPTRDILPGDIVIHCRLCYSIL